LRHYPGIFLEVLKKNTKVFEPGTSEYKIEALELEQSRSEFGLKFSLCTWCPKSLVPMGILIIFLICIYRLKLKAERLNMTLTLDERMEIVLGDF
jgi:hypothetical protein